MARYLFGAGIADYVITSGEDNAVVFTPGANVTFYNAQTTGTQYTDLTEADKATALDPSAVVADDSGHLSTQFAGPDGLVGMWADGNGGAGPRVWIETVELGSLVQSLDDQINDSLTGLVPRVETLEDNVATGGGASVKERPWEVVAADTTPSALQAAVDDLLAERIGNAVQRTLYLPPGEYHLTTPLLADNEALPAMLENVRIEGAGIRSTRIYWDRTDSTPFIRAAAPRIRWLTMKGATFTAASSNAVWAYLYSTQGGAYNQAWVIEDCEWTGSWLRGIGLDGGTNGNLNSEFTLNRVFTSPSSTWADAFFVSGLTNNSTENQFLDYWIRDSCLSLASGTMFRFRRGGSVTVENGSWSANSSSGTILWFDWPTAQSNNPDRSQMLVSRVRFEPKGSGHKILSSQAADGMFTFQSCSDQGASQNSGTYTHERYTITGNNIWSGNVAPIVRFQDCSMGGYVRYAGGAQTKGGFVFDGCKVYRGDLGQKADEIQGGTNPILQWSSGAPHYRFTNGWNYDDQSSWTVT